MTLGQGLRLELGFQLGLGLASLADQTLTLSGESLVLYGPQD